VTPEKILARLTPKPQSFSLAPGGIPDITSEDASMALSGLNGGPHYICRLKYCGDTTMITKLIAVGLTEISKLAVERKWGTPKEGEWRGLIHLAIYEVMTPPHCPLCRGSGIIHADPHPKPCFVCGTSGTLKLDNERKADIAGMTVERFKQYRRRYEDVYRMFYGWEVKGLYHIARRMED